MANNYYDHTTFPVPNAAGQSSTMRNELDAIEAGFDKLPAFSAGVSSQVILATSTGLTTSSALSSFSISSSDLTACTLSDTTMSAATITNLGATNISATGTFNISASSGKLINVQIGSAGQTKNIFASAITTNSLNSTGNTDLSIFNFNGSVMSADSTANIKLSGGYPFTDIDRTFVKTYHLEAVATSKMTYLMGQTAAGTGLAIHFNNNNIINLNTATETLGATNLGQVSALLSFKFDKAGGVVTGTSSFTNNVTFENAVNFSADINLLTNQITNVGTATNGLMAVNKNQLDLAIADLVSSAPSLLNSLSEISAALNNDESFAANMISALATKLNLNGTNAMSADLNLDSNKIINLATSSATHHAVNQAELNAVNNANLNVTGGSVGALSLTGNINLQSAHGVINAASVTANTTGTNLSTKEYVDRKGIALQMVYSI
nr:hypothetical protein 17 [Burkholderiaceae bacterium]